MLVVLIATGAIVKDYVLGSVLFAVVVLLSFAIGRGRMAASFSFAYLFLMGIFWVTTMLPPNAAGALGSFALACRTCMPICLFAAVFATTTKIGDLTAALYGMRLPKAVVVPLVIAVRFFPTLKEESSAVADAMRVRGLALSLKNLVSKPALMFESRDAALRQDRRRARCCGGCARHRPAWKEDLLQRAPVRMGRFPASLDPCRLLLASCGC